MNRVAMLGAMILIGGCNSAPEAEPAPANMVQTSGKQEVQLGQLPPAVLAAVRERAPEIRIDSAEKEQRDGRNYLDIGGTLPDGSEIEFDVMEDAGSWRIVETQRDIDFAAAPEAVQSAVKKQDASLASTRVIESRQEDGLVIYEVYAPAGGDPQGRKIEVKWDGKAASILTSEWAH